MTSRLRLPRPIAIGMTTLALLATTGGGSVAWAMSPAPIDRIAANRPLPREAELEEEVEWEWEEEEEEIEVELEFEETETSGSTAEAHPPSECPLGDAKARVTAENASQALRITLRHAPSEPVEVIVYRPGGTRGAIRLEPPRRRDRPGTLGGTMHLSELQMERVRAAGTLVIDIDLPGASDACRHHSTRRLTVTRHNRARTVFSEAPQLPRRS